MDIVEQIFALFAHRGEEAYFGEAVSQQAHALQAAHLAEQENAPDSLVVAALLHDIGHLVHGMDEDIAEHDLDGRHEIAGEVWLAATFGPEITEPVKLHVAAKRYLCATDAEYAARLSPASVQSLRLQGGAFNMDEAREFERNPFYREAVRLRHWDDAAKIPGLDVPGLEHYRTRLEAAVKRDAKE